MTEQRMLEAFGEEWLELERFIIDKYAGCKFIFHGKDHPITVYGMFNLLKSQRSEDDINIPSAIQLKELHNYLSITRLDYRDTYLYST